MRQVGQWLTTWSQELEYLGLNPSSELNSYMPLLTLPLCLSFLIFKTGIIVVPTQYGSPGGTAVKNPPAILETTCKAGAVDSVPGPGRSPGGGNGSPLQCSCLGNPMDRRTWRAIVHGVTKNRTQEHTHKHIHP